MCGIGATAAAAAAVARGGSRDCGSRGCGCSHLLACAVPQGVLLHFTLCCGTSNGSRQLIWLWWLRQQQQQQLTLARSIVDTRSCSSYWHGSVKPIVFDAVNERCCVLHTSCVVASRCYGAATAAISCCNSGVVAFLSKQLAAQTRMLQCC
jgi:hypothetical protein